MNYQTFTYSISIHFGIEEQGCVLKPEPIRRPPDFLSSWTRSRVHSCCFANKELLEKTHTHTKYIYIATYQCIFPFLQKALKQYLGLVHSHVGPWC